MNTVLIQSALDAVGVPLLVFRNDTILFTNRAALAFLHYTASPKAWAELLRPDLQMHFADWMKRGQLAEPIELQLLTIDQSTIQVRMTAEAMQFGEMDALIGTLKPVETVPLTGSALGDEQGFLHSRQVLQLVMDTTPIAISWKDRDSVFLGCNRQASLDLNLPSPEAIIGKTDYDLPSADEAEHYRAVDRRVMESGIPELNFEEPQTRPDGSIAWLRTSKVPLRGVDGQVIGVLVMYENITERKLAEEALKASEETLRLITDNAKDIISKIDLEGIVQYASPSVKRVLGYEPAELIGQPAMSLIHPDDMSVIVESFQASVVHDLPDPNIEYRYRHKDGHYIWVETSGTVIRDKDGQFVAAISAGRDITFRKQAEEALRQSEERYRLISELISDYATVTDIAPDGTPTLQWLTTDSFSRLTGYSAEEVQGKNQSEALYKLIHPEDEAAVREDIVKTSQGEITRSEYRIFTKSGDIRWLNVHRYPVWDEHHQRVVRFYGSGTDITERKRAEEKLRASEERLRLITDNMHDMVSMVDKEFRFRYASPSHFNTVGYQAEALVGQTVLDYVHPEDVPVVSVRFQEAFDQRKSETGECRFRHADGYYIWIETSGQPIYDSNGNFTGAVFTTRDVSERRWMQKSLVEQERMLVTLEKEKELSALKTRMMSRLSHELRTPLAIISTSADLLENYFERMTPEKRQERLQQIRHQVQHYTAMLDNMSLVVKGVTYHPDFSPSPYDPIALCHEVIEEVRDTLKARQEVRLDFSGSAPSINADEQYMRLILTNLLSNALKYSVADSVIDVNLHTTEQQVILKVTDKGIGIPEADRPKIFDAFFRGSNIGEVPGLGIGLSIVSEIVSASQGSIAVESEVGKSTTMIVQLPILEVTATRA
jgi:PAS domain S-box-containing protein